MVSMRNGRFVAVGTGAPVPGPGVRIVDLKGRTVVPGIIDNHNHIVLMGNRPGYHTPLENASSIRDVQEILAARAAGIPRGAWITTIGGFHRNQLFPAAGTPRLPTLAELDEAGASRWPAIERSSRAGDRALVSTGAVRRRRAQRSARLRMSGSTPPLSQDGDLERGLDGGVGVEGVDLRRLADGS